MELALEERPDLIITDFMMPKMTGLEMIAALRARGFTGPIVLTTSIPENQLPTQPGYDAYVSKPYSETLLNNAIQSASARNASN